jgi:hypothetical protein
MGFIQDLRDTLKPFLVFASCLVVVSFLFITLYVLYDYKGYLQTHQDLQGQEIEESAHKTEAIIKNVKKVIALAENRIRAANGDTERIRTILKSSDSISPKHILPSFQKFSYTKLSKTPEVITRFGAFPLKTEFLAQDLSISKEMAVTFSGNIIIAKYQVLNDQGKLDGIIEVEINPSDFKAVLGNFTTIELVLGKENSTHEHNPIFSVKAKTPNQLWGYISDHKTHFLIFGFYMLFLICFTMIGAGFLNQYLKKQYQAHIDKLETERANLAAKSDSLNQALANSQRDYSHHQLSCQAHKTFHSGFHNQQKEQASYIARSLTLLEKSFKDSTLQLSDLEYLSLINSMRSSAQVLSRGCLTSLKSESVNLKQVLEEIRLFFAERIQKMSLTLDINCFEDLEFTGDPVFTEFILLNLIGKSIHRVPKEGKVSINVSELDGAVSLEVIDNGFLIAGSTEKLIRKSFDFYVPEDVFGNTCQENGLIYQHSKTTGGLNRTIITIPTIQEEVATHNVVQLFK